MGYQICIPDATSAKASRREQEKEQNQSNYTDAYVNGKLRIFAPIFFLHSDSIFGIRFPSKHISQQLDYPIAKLGFRCFENTPKRCYLFSSRICAHITMPNPSFIRKNI